MHQKEPGDFALLHLSYQTPKYDVAFLKSKIFEKKIKKKMERKKKKNFWGRGLYYTCSTKTGCNPDDQKLFCN